MKGAQLILLFLFQAALAAACPFQDGRGEGPAEGRPADELAFLEVAATRDTYFVQEPICLKIRFGFDAPFFRSNAIQLFRRHLDVPLRIEARWIDDLPGTVALADEQGGRDRGGQAATWSFALNDGMAEARRCDDRLVNGRLFTVLEIERWYLATDAGGISVPAARLSFAYATRFRDDLINGRVAEDRHDRSVTAGHFFLAIEPLPGEERPPDFLGAVGRFSVLAEASPVEIAMGESLKLSLRIEGRGNLQFFEPPRLDHLAGFHIFGSIDHRGVEKRTVTWDITPLSVEVEEIPPVPFTFFDTTPPAGFRTLRTRPISIHVRPPSRGGAAGQRWSPDAGRLLPGETDIFDVKPLVLLSSAGKPGRLSPIIFFGLLFLPWPLAIGLLIRLRALERDRNDPGGVRARRAAGLFRKAVTRPETDLAHVVAEYLGARCRCPAAAMIDPDLPDRLAARGVPPGLAARASDMLGVLIDARFGGRPQPIARESARDLVDELELIFLEKENNR